MQLFEFRTERQYGALALERSLKTQGISCYRTVINNLRPLAHTRGYRGVPTHKIRLLARSIVVLRKETGAYETRLHSNGTNPPPLNVEAPGEPHLPDELMYNDERWR